MLISNKTGLPPTQDELFPAGGFELRLSERTPEQAEAYRDAFDAFYDPAAWAIALTGLRASDPAHDEATCAACIYDAQWNS